MAYNPLDDPIPDDPIQQVRAFARDLAYGVIENYWSATLFDRQNNINIENNQRFKEYLEHKWGSNPGFDLLIVFGYIQRQQLEYELSSRTPRIVDPSLSTPRGINLILILTEKAFALLEHSDQKSIFISYCRKESSALALLLLARFKLIGQAPFLDMLNIKPGNNWHAQLEKEVKDRRDFVCLVGPTSLESEYVRQEILWALEENKRIIPIWHNSFDGDKWEEQRKIHPAIADFFNNQAIPVELETVLAYDNAVRQLFNGLGIMD